LRNRSRSHVDAWIVIVIPREKGEGKEGGRRNRRKTHLSVRKSFEIVVVGRSVQRKGRGFKESHEGAFSLRRASGRPSRTKKRRKKKASQ